jgi:hypothetical protein
MATGREVVYVEEKGATCPHQAHRRNHTLPGARQVATTLAIAKAS